MTNAIKNYNSLDPSNETKAFKIDFTQSHTHPKVPGLVDPIFKKIKDLSFRHLGSPTYLIASQEDTITQKTLKIAGWVFGISPTILITACLYDALLDLYRQRFQKYSTLEECLNEEPINPEQLRVGLSQEPTSEIEDMPESTIHEELESHSSDAPKTAETPKETLQDETPNIPTMEQPKELHNETVIEDISENIVQEESESNSSSTPEENTEVPEELSIQAEDILSSVTQEASQKTPTIEIPKDVHDQELESETDGEKSFEMVNMSPELLEEMKNTPEATPTRMRQVLQAWEKAKTFFHNPFNSKTWKVVTLPDSTIHEDTKEPSYKDFEMLTPITVSHETTAMDTTAFSIDQIKKDLSRMKIFINGTHCLNIQDFVSHLNLTLNTDETDILPGDNPIIRKILHFSHQGLLREAQGAIQAHVMQYPDKFPAQITNREDKPLTIHINWNAEFPEETEITGEISYHVKSMVDGSILPYIYTVKTRCSLDNEEISWEAVEDIPVELPTSLEEPTQAQENEIESPFEMIDSSEATEDTNESDNSFTLLESPITTESDNESFEDLEIPDNMEDNTNNNRDIALDHLLHKPNSCLNSTVTSEYLNSLKIKYPNFVFDDRLMFPVSITTDEIATSLNNLKNNNSNQLIFLPFLVKGLSVDHAVTAVINLSNETIEYFDPKGQSWFTTRTEKQSKKNVFDFLTELGQKVISSTFSKDKILYNEKNIPQGFSDNINCGAFCLQFIEERITRSFESIEDDMAIDPMELRRQLANKLIQNTYSNLV